MNPPVDNPNLAQWAQRLETAAAAGRPCFFLLDFALLRPRLWVLGEDAAVPDFVFPGGRSGGAGPRERGLRQAPPVRIPSLRADHISPDRFRAAFDLVQAGLRRGDTFLTNLTFATPIELAGTPEDVFRHSEAKYRIHLPGEFVCFSPETFVTISATGYIESRPMKGTAEDTPAARAALLASPKEIAEHATIVDLIRNDLSQVARRVRVTDYRYLRPTASGRRPLVQTSSKIGGQLPTDWRATLGRTLLRLLPAGSVSGAPKPATLDLIRAAEDGPRGYYCGIGGYFDGRSLDTCVLIRFIEPGPGGHYFRSGGGITARSNWEEEYRELRAKIRIPLAVRRFSLP